MPISKKDRIRRDQKKADAAGTRAPVKANGNPVKAPKPTSICANCRREIVNTNLVQLEVHAATHNEKLWPKEKCWPNDFKAEDKKPAAKEPVMTEPVAEPDATEVK